MYILEGNIGAGKSTFLNLLVKHMPQISVALEPLYNWQSTVYGQSLLANFYQNPKRWAYTLETLTMMCRVREHMEEQKNPNLNRIFERSIYSGHYCFALNGFESGFMSALEWQLYKQWLDFLVPGKCNPPLGFIYLHADPKICFERIKKRNRLAEKKLTLKYLKQIHEKHETFLIEKKNLFTHMNDIPVLVLDCNEEFEHNEMKFKEHIRAVERFLVSTQIVVKPQETRTLTTSL